MKLFHVTTDIKTRETELTPLDSVEARAPGDDCLVVIYASESTQFGKRYVLTTGPLLIGRGTENDVVLDNDIVSRQHCRFDRKSDKWFVSDDGSTNGTYVNDVPVKEQSLRQGDQIKVGDTIFKFLSGSDVEAQYHETIYRITIMDGLTGIHNKRYLLDTLEREIPRARRHSRPLSLLMMDIDHFKSINDSCGHLAGDAVLKELASLVRSRLRPDDVVGRYGGEEFAVILPETTLEGAKKIANELRILVEEHDFAFEGQSMPLTVSIGAAEMNSDIDQFGFIKLADERLYDAKRAGRNQVAG
jgi:two-component system, cell cycle response regulator